MTSHLKRLLNNARQAGVHVSGLNRRHQALAASPTPAFQHVQGDELPPAGPKPATLSLDVLPDCEKLNLFKDRFGRARQVMMDIGMEPGQFATGKTYLIVYDRDYYQPESVSTPLAVFEHDHVPDLGKIDKGMVIGALSDIHAKDVFRKLGRMAEYGSFAEIVGTPPADLVTGKVAWLQERVLSCSIPIKWDKYSDISNRLGDGAHEVIERERSHWRVVRDWTGQLKPPPATVPANPYMEAIYRSCGDERDPLEIRRTRQQPGGPG